MINFTKEDELLSQIDNELQKFSNQFANKITYTITADDFETAEPVIDKILDKHSGKHRVEIVVNLNAKKINWGDDIY